MLIYIYSPSMPFSFLMTATLLLIGSISLWRPTFRPKLRHPSEIS